MSLAKEINEIALENDAKNIQSFVVAFIMQGHGIMDFVDYLADDCDLYYSYSAVYNVIRPLIPDEIFDLIPVFKLNNIAKIAGYDSVVEMLNDFDDKPSIVIAKTLGCDIACAKRFIKKYNVALPAMRNAFAQLKKYRKTKDGFKRLKSMTKWEGQAKALGYNTVRQAFTKLKAEGLTDGQIASLFCVSRQTLWVRKRAMRLL